MDRAEAPLFPVAREVLRERELRVNHASKYANNPLGAHRTDRTRSRRRTRKALRDGVHRAVVAGRIPGARAAGQPIVVAARKNRALLALLALTPSGSMARERIAGLLWSDRGAVQALSSLRQGLVALRKDFASIGSPFLSADNERVSLDTARVETDVVAFRELAASDDVVAVRRAAALYRGELLADTYIRDRALRSGWVRSEGGSPISRATRWRNCARSSGAGRR